MSAVADAAPGRRKALLQMSLALVLAMSPWFSATAVVVQLRARWGFGDSFAAWLTIAVQLGFVAGALGSALLGLADRIPARRLIVAAAVGTALTLQLGLGFLLTVATIWIVPLLAAALGSWRWVLLALLPGPVLGIAAMLALMRARPKTDQRHRPA